MAKPWKDVEANPEYQAMTPERQQMAKQQYFRDVVSVKPEYKSLPPEKQQMAQSQFFGTPKPSAQTKENPNLIDKPLETLAKSGGDFVGGIAESVIHPVRTAKALGGLAVGAAEKLIPGKQDQEKYVDALANQYAERYGGFDKAKKTILEDPIGFMSDASMLIGGAGGALKAVGEAGNVSKLAEAGKLAGKVASAVDPISGTLSAIGKGGELALKGKKLAPFADKLDKPVIKAANDLGIDMPASAISKSKAVPAIEAIAGKGLFGGGVVDKVEKAHDQLSKVADQVIAKTGKTPDLTVAGKAVFDGTEKYRAKFMEIKNALYDSANLDGAKIEVTPSKSLAFIDDVLKNKSDAAELLGSAQDIQYFSNLKKGLTQEKTISKTTTGPHLENIVETSTHQVPLEAKKVQSAIRELNEKIKNTADPIATGNRATLKKLVTVLHEDLDTAIKQQRPDLAQAIDMANAFYKDGIEKLNSAYGERIYELGRAGQFDKIVPAITSASASADDIPRIFEIIGKNNVPALQSAYLEEFFKSARNADGKFTPTGIAIQIKRGGRKLAAILTPEQYKTIKSMARASFGLGKADKIASGSQTAFLTRLAAEASLLFVNPVAAFKALGVDAGMSKFVGSKFGQRALTNGVNFTDFGKKINRNVSTFGKSIKRPVQTLRVSNLASERG